MKILLVGASSALARTIFPMLSTQAEVVTAGRKNCDLTLDLTWPPEKLRLPRGIDVVINTAAHFGGANFDGLSLAEHVNAGGALRLCHAARIAGARHFVQISSVNASLTARSAYFDAYALSKRHGDELLELYCTTESQPLTILRPSQLYSTADSFGKHQRFLYGTLKKALHNEEIVIFGKHNALRNYLHADDLCRQIAAVVRYRIPGTYTCTAKKDTGLFDLATLLVRAARSGSSIRFDETKADIPDNVFPYDDALYRITGIYPAISIEEGIQCLVDGRRGNS